MNRSAALRGCRQLGVMCAEVWHKKSEVWQELPPGGPARPPGMGAIIGSQPCFEAQDATTVQAGCTGSVGTLQTGREACLNLLPRPNQRAPGQRPFHRPPSRPDKALRPGYQRRHFRLRLLSASAGHRPVGIDAKGAAHGRAVRGIETTAVASEITWMVERLAGPILHTAPEGVIAYAT